MAASVTSSAPHSSEQRHVELLRLLSGREITDASIEISAIAGFELSEAAARPFVNFVNWVNQRPHFIAQWRADPQTESRDYLRFMTISDGARCAYAAVCYHLDRVKELEAAVDAALSRYDFSKAVPKNSVTAFGNTQKLDFEYQSFVLAYRRCLDYLSWGLSTYFQVKQGSYNKFRKTLASGTPASVAKPMLAAYDRHRSKFDFVVGAQRGQSVRDRISHFEFVQAGTINVGVFGHRIVGGGENLRLRVPSNNESLAQVLELRAADLHACIEDMLDSFCKSVDRHEDNACR